MREEIAQRIIGRAKAAFVAACVGALYFLVKYETEFNTPVIWAFKNLTLPIGLVMLVIAIFFHRSCRELLGKTGCKWLAIILIPILTLLCGPYVSAVNAIFPPQREQLIKGTVFDKYHSRFTSTIAIQRDDNRELVRFIAAGDNYKKLKKGDRFTRIYSVGCLGMRYRERF